MYERLLAHFGPQYWWPGDTTFEICLGAILTQNTAWTNVEKAIINVKQAGLLDFKKCLFADDATIASLIRPAGYFNVKTKRLRSFLVAVHENHRDLDALFELSEQNLREFLLSIKGIGPETADSMVLYAFGKPSFVIDAYTKRILTRHDLILDEATYDDMKEFFERHLEADEKVFNEFHALIVATAKDFCRKTKPDCEHCPLRDLTDHNFYGPIVPSL